MQLGIKNKASFNFRTVLSLTKVVANAFHVDDLLTPELPGNKIVREAPVFRPPPPNKHMSTMYP